MAYDQEIACLEETIDGLVNLKSDKMSYNEGLIKELGGLMLDFQALTSKMSIGTDENEALDRE